MHFRTALKIQAQRSSHLIKRLFFIKLVRAILLGLFLLLVTPFIVFFFIRPKPAKDINYGITYSHKYAEQMGMNWKDVYLKILDDMNTKNLRLVVYWDETEKEMDTYDYSIIKWQLDEAEKRNVNVILTMGRKVPRYPECFEPDWWKNISSEDIRNEELYAYIFRTIKELKGYKSIKMWQVENEPFFPFGTCLPIKKEVVEKEIAVARGMDSRPILVQDSGEGGFWFPSYKMADYLGISMYRKIWYDFWGVFFGRFIYFQYPLSYWSYKIRANVFGVPPEKIIVTELQAEPWGPGLNPTSTEEEKEKTMSRIDFLATINYAQKTGFKDLYLWGAEWWLWEKEVNGNPFYWDTAKALFRK
jgi:hypothetical protein